MKCSRCHFENMPGQNRCFKCGSVLEAGADTVDVHPPRMSGWRKPFRGLLRWSRRHQRVSEKLPTDHVRRAWDKVTSDGPTGFFLSIIPGLAHALNGRFREVRWIVLAWFVLLSTGLFLYGSSVGYLLVGLAIGLHAWIALQYGVLREIPGLMERLGVTLAAVAFFALLYWGTPRILLRGYTGGYTALTIPDMQISEGDYLFARRLGRLEEPLPRGTLVLVHPLRFRNNIAELLREQPAMFGQIIGRPGEIIRIAVGFYAVGDEPLDPERFPVPRWLANRTITVRVRPGYYFVSSAYTVQVHGNARLTDDAIRNACLVEAEDIEGRAFMRWWPLTRRGFIE